MSASASWPFSKVEVYSDSLEIRTFAFFTNLYKREEITDRRWTLLPVLIDGIAINKSGSFGFRLFGTFRAKRLLDELEQAGFTTRGTPPRGW